MKNFDLSAQRFGKLVAVDHVWRSSTMHFWLCVCDCGEWTVTTRHALISKGLKSCGCFLAESVSARKTRHGHSAGRRGTPEYRAWVNAKHRCLNEASASFPHYGGRGITMCQEWRDSFEAFWADMGPRPQGCSLDRIDNDGHYEPSNCRWAEAKTQRRNTSRTLFVKVDGRKMPLVDFGLLHEVHPVSVKAHLKRGRSPEEAVQIIRSDPRYKPFRGYRRVDRSSF